MKIARYIQWALLGLGSIVGIALALNFSRLAFDTPGDAPSSGYGWGEVLSEAPGANEPAETQDGIVFDGSAPSAEAVEFFGRSNGFVASSGLIMLAGLAGFGLIIAAIARRPSGRFAPLAVLAASGVILAGSWLFGFNTSYPGDFALGGVAPGSLGGPLLAGDAADIDPYEYGLAFTIWTDFFYQSAFAVSSGVFVIGLMAGRFRTPLVLLAAITTGCFGFPLATSWLWGGGWLSNLGAMDFGGAGNVHLLAGGVGLALVALARICPPVAPWQLQPTMPNIPVPRQPTPVRMTAPWMVAFVVGALAFLLLPVGMQAGSVLAIDTPVVASVLHNTMMCLAGAVAAAVAVSIPLTVRPRGVTPVIAALAGLAAIAAPADVLTGIQSLMLGLLVGTVCSLLAWCSQRFGFDDPLGLVAAHLIGAMAGMIAVGIASPDAPLLVQLIAIAAFTTLGLAIGACLGLLGWMTGMLWTTEGQKEAEELVGR